MPPLKVAAEILRETTERLAAEVVSPAKAAPQWSELHWAIAPASATIHGISALLYRRLNWSGPPCWQAFLEDQHTRSELRHHKICALLDTLDATLRDSAVGAVALKGAALRKLNVYADGERPMGDVDLLVRHSDVERVEKALAAVHYRRIAEFRRHIVFGPAQKHTTYGLGEHQDNPVPIEVHTTITEQLPIRTTDITGFLWPEALQPGINPYGSIRSLLLHLLLHASGNLRRRTLRQIQMHDIALLAESLEDKDWDMILQSSDPGRPRWWLFPALAITDRYYPNVIPRHVLSSARQNCPILLRAATRELTLTEGSFSNLRILAFPGLAWSQTPLDALRFMGSRVVPSRVALDELSTDVDVNRRLGQLPWYGLPHAARMVRWLSGRAPRVQTMLTLRDAIESASNTPR